MTYYVGVPVLLLAALIEASVLPLFRVYGIQPNLTLVLLIAWLMVRGQQETLFLIPLAGLFLGLVDAAPLGVAMLALAPVALIHELRTLHLGESHLVITVGFTIMATLAYHLVYLLVMVADGQASGWLYAFRSVALPSAALNVIVLAPAYWAVWLLSRDLRRPAYA